MKKTFFISLALCFPNLFASFQTSFSDSIIDEVYNTNSKEDITSSDFLKKHFTKEALSKFITNYKQSKMQENIVKYNYVSTVFKDTPTTIVKTTPTQTITSSQLHVFLTNANEQMIIPLQVTIHSQKDKTTTKVTQFTANVVGKISLVSPKDERLKKCGAYQSNSRTSLK